MHARRRRFEQHALADLPRAVRVGAGDDLLAAVFRLRVQVSTLAKSLDREHAGRDAGRRVHQQMLRAHAHRHLVADGERCCRRHRNLSAACQRDAASIRAGRADLPGQKIHRRRNRKPAR
jgi:hypothetical protein